MRYCAWPRCSNKVEYGYCAIHEASRQKLPKRRQDNRSPSERGYDSRWRYFRNSYLAKHTYCEWCGEPAEELHHKTPLKEGGNRLDSNNVVAVCRICHRRAHEHRNKSKGN